MELQAIKDRTLPQENRQSLTNSDYVGTDKIYNIGINPKTGKISLYECCMDSTTYGSWLRVFPTTPPDNYQDPEEIRRLGERKGFCQEYIDRRVQATKLRNITSAIGYKDFDTLDSAIEQIQGSFEPEDTVRVYSDPSMIRTDGRLSLKPKSAPIFITDGRLEIGQLDELGKPNTEYNPLSSSDMQKAILILSGGLERRLN